MILHRIAILALGALVQPALAEDLVLPEDLLLAVPGGLSSVAAIKQISSNTFEVTRYIDPASSPDNFNMVTFCVASSLAKKHGYGGWVHALRQDDAIDSTFHRYTVVLLNDAGDAKNLPTKVNWTLTSMPIAIAVAEPVAT